MCSMFKRLIRPRTFCLVMGLMTYAVHQEGYGLVLSEEDFKRSSKSSPKSSTSKDPFSPSRAINIEPNKPSTPETLLPTHPKGNDLSITLYLLIVPVSYQNERITMSQDEIEKLFFDKKDDSFHSVREFFKKNSRGKFLFEGYVVPPEEVVLQSNKIDYINKSNQSANLKFIVEIGKELGDYLDPSSDFNPDTNLTTSNYDMNGDKYIDILVFFHAGEGEELALIKGNSIISHKFSYRRVGSNGLNFRFSDGPLAGLYFGRYIVVGEYNNPTATNVFKKATIGTLCHELGHILGLVDLYNTDDSDDLSVGRTALMGNGNYNASLSNKSIRASLPAPFIGINKIILGWETPLVIRSDRKEPYTIEDYSDPTSSKNLYKVVGRQTNQYWLIEYRNGTDFDEGFHNAKGLFIWHINNDVLGITTEQNPITNHYFLTKQGLQEEPTNRAIQLEEPLSIMGSPSNNITNVSQTHFWYTDASDFTPFSKPNSRYHPSELHSGVSILNIRPQNNNNEAMQFEVRIQTPSAPAPYTTTSYPNPFIPKDGHPLQILVNHAPKRNLDSFPKNVVLKIVSRAGKVHYEFSHRAGNLFFIDQNTSLAAKWKGQDMKGRNVPTGVYYQIIVGDEFRWVVGRFLLLR